MIKKQLWIILVLALSASSFVYFNLQFTWLTLGMILLCFVSELMDSSLGMGYGTTLTPLLLAAGYDPLDLVPTILLSEFLSGFSSSYFHHETGNVVFTRKSADFRIATTLALGSVIGVTVGVNLALQIPAQMLKLFIGIIILLAGICIWIFIDRPIVFKSWKMFVLASLASFNKALSGGGYGPLLTSGQILSGVKGRASVAITSFAEGFTCLVGVILFIWQGQKLQVELMVPVITGALLAVPVSVELVKKLDENNLKKGIATLTIIMGIFTIWKVFA